jgi:predicted enzyme related to lactoylglutathione lyase
VSDRPELSHVFAFTEMREHVASFYEEVLGVIRERPHDDSVWFTTTTGAQLVVHDREDEPASGGFVPWFHVIDLDAAFARAQATGRVVGGMRDGYFLVKDPDDRVFGVRKRRP